MTVKTKPFEPVRSPELNGTASIVSETEAFEVANLYVKTNIGEEYDVVRPHAFPDSVQWSFYVERRFPDLMAPVTVGRVWVNAHSNEVIPMSDDEIWDVQERALVRAEHKRGHQVAFGSEGLILPYQAKIAVNGYMSDYVAFYSGAEGQPEFIQGKPPFWRVATALRLREYGRVTGLGTILVNALTGRVFPLTAQEIEARQKQAKNAAITAQRSAKPSG